jgi:hypothetical protein
MDSIGALGYLDCVKGGNHKSPFEVQGGCPSSGFLEPMAA